MEFESNNTLAKEFVENACDYLLSQHYPQLHLSFSLAQRTVTVQTRYQWKSPEAFLASF